MSAITEVRTEVSAPRHEAYSFICLDCGRSWEQEYDVSRYVDGAGVSRVRCTSPDGKLIRSPLTHPYCPSCESTVLRVLPAGTSTSMLRALFGPPRPHGHGFLHRIFG